MSNFDFDEFQQEIDAAEKYLKETNAKKREGKLFLLITLYV